MEEMVATEEITVKVTVMEMLEEMGETVVVGSTVGMVDMVAMEEMVDGGGIGGSGGDGSGDQGSSEENDQRPSPS